MVVVLGGGGGASIGAICTGGGLTDVVGVIILMSVGGVGHCASVMRPHLFAIAPQLGGMT